MNKYLTEEIVNLYFEKKNTPPHVIAHCLAVRDVAVNIGQALNNSGFNLDIDLIFGAAMIHDVARTEEEHWNVAADMLKSDGFIRESEIVRVHMFYPGFNRLVNVNEADLVCLADRVVKENKFVGLDERIAYIINKAGNIPERTRHILKSKEDTERFIKEIEASTHLPFVKIAIGEY